jgi:hypothetical protein
MTNLTQHLDPVITQKGYKIFFKKLETASVVEGLESMTSNPGTSLAWVRSPGDALVVNAEEGNLVLL